MKINMMQLSKFLAWSVTGDGYVGYSTNNKNAHYSISRSPEHKDYLEVIASKFIGLQDCNVRIDENPPYSVTNDDRYNSYKTPDSIPMLFLVSAQAKGTKNADIVNRFMTSVKIGDIKLLKSEAVARGLTSEKDGAKLANFLLPFVQTDRLIDEVMNLEYVQKGNTTSVRQVSNAIEKDRYSALAYGNFYIYLREQKESRRNSRTSNSAVQFFSMKKPKYDSFGTDKKKTRKGRPKRRR